MKPSSQKWMLSSVFINASPTHDPSQSWRARYLHYGVSMIGGEEHGGGVDNPQPDRVGSEDDDDDEANRDGPGGEDDNTSDEDDDDPETPQQDEANCWGQTTSDVVKC